MGKEFFEDIKRQVSYLVDDGCTLSSFHTELFLVLPMSVRIFGYSFEGTETDICYLYLYDSRTYEKITEYCFEIQFNELLEVIHIDVVSNSPTE